MKGLSFMGEEEGISSSTCKALFLLQGIEEGLKTSGCHSSGSGIGRYKYFCNSLKKT
jgi:hypothetical protein